MVIQFGSMKLTGSFNWFYLLTCLVSKFSCSVWACHNVSNCRLTMAISWCRDALLSTLPCVVSILCIWQHVQFLCPLPPPRAPVL